MENAEVKGVLEFAQSLQLSFSILFFFLTVMKLKPMWQFFNTPLYKRYLGNGKIECVSVLYLVDAAIIHKKRTLETFFFSLRESVGYVELMETHLDKFV